MQEREVRNGQLTLYYMNLFQILCGLVETSLLRALEYQEAMEYKEICREYEDPEAGIL